ncbi:hypothetical protein [Streptomyces sp. NPDC058664]|uniref:hypothetical protein n=1 Tax=unclassified Streptomyces TaxID=2593676 RepID=UPI003649995A
MTLHAIGHTARALCAVSLVIAPLALAAAPAHAVTSCTVNGVPRSGPTVNGTAGSDSIVCPSVDPGHSVKGLGGDDYIVLTGTTAGTVSGGQGRDYVTSRSNVLVTGLLQGNESSDYLVVDGRVAPGGIVRGSTGNDYRGVNANDGTANGGEGFDARQVNVGRPPITCEY